jgi:hypothetical protein
LIIVLGIVGIVGIGVVIGAVLIAVFGGIVLTGAPGPDVGGAVLIGVPGITAASDATVEEGFSIISRLLHPHLRYATTSKSAAEQLTYLYT